MKNTSLFVSAALLLLFTACGNPDKAVNGDSDPMPDTSARVSAGPVDGKSIFRAKCTVCHGEDGKKGVMGAADLTGSIVSEEGATLIVKNGKNAMTAFGGQLSDDEISAVVKYIMTLRK